MKTKLIFLALITIVILQSCGSGTSYQEKVQSIEEMEKSEPLSFLSITGKYQESFWGDKIEVTGTIFNSATVASYKDAKIRISFLTKTSTLLRTEVYTLYEIFKPNNQVNFHFEVNNYKDVYYYRVDIIEVMPIN